jgi:hypothetical protein
LRKLTLGAHHRLTKKSGEEETMILGSRRWRARALSMLLALLPPSYAEARIAKLDIIRIESPAFEGRSFGTVGTYDKIVAQAAIAVDPADPHNAGIVDLALAPKNARGLVEAVSEVEILRPSDPAKANGLLFYEVVNRGRKLSFQLFDDAPAAGVLATADQVGNGFLLSRGYTIVWAGWQGDVAAGEGRLTFAPPVLTGVTGPSREEFVFDNAFNPVVAPLTYAVADGAEAKVSLTVREHADDQRTTPAGLSFTFVDLKHVSITRPATADEGAIYEFIYEAKNPMVMGLGFVVTRDLV